MMKLRIAHGKILVILFFCFILISQLAAAPQNGTVTANFDMGGGNACGSFGNSAVLDISAGTITVSGLCKENGLGPDLPFSFSGTFPSGIGFKTGAASQTVNGVTSNTGFEGGITYNSINIIGLLGNGLIISGNFETLSTEPIPTLSEWGTIFLVLILGITTFIKLKNKVS